MSWLACAGCGHVTPDGKTCPPCGKSPVACECPSAPPEKRLGYVKPRRINPLERLDTIKTLGKARKNQGGDAK